MAKKMKKIQKKKQKFVHIFLLSLWEKTQKHLFEKKKKKKKRGNEDDDDDDDEDGNRATERSRFFLFLFFFFYSFFWEKRREKAKSIFEIFFVKICFRI